MNSVKNTLATKSERELIASQVSPTLTVVKETYGAPVLQLTLSEFLVDAAKMYGLEYSNRSEQITSIADMISATHFDLKMSEIMIFFSMLKSGRLRDRSGNDAAKMYGNFNGEVIADCLYRFREYRANELDKIEREAALKRADEIRNRPGTVTYNEWCEMTGRKPDPIVEMAVGKVSSPKTTPVQQVHRATPSEQEARPKSTMEMLSILLTPQQIAEWQAGTLDPNKYAKKPVQTQSQTKPQSPRNKKHKNKNKRH